MPAHGLLRYALGAALFACPLVGSPVWAATPKIVVRPLRSAGDTISFPRLVRFPDARVRRRVNAALARQERADRAQRALCLATLRQQGRQPHDGALQARIATTYVSRHYLSVEVHLAYYCGGAYPTNDAPEPLTFDLSTGAPVTWSALFKPGVLSPGGDPAAPSRLAALYRKRYAASDAEKECKDVVAGDGVQLDLMLWLDARKGGVVAMPDLPHVVEACAKPLAFTPAELGPDIADPAFLADLKATAARQ